MNLSLFKESQRLRILVLVISPIFLFVFTFGVWNTIHDENDPKNGWYLLWKAGIYKMNLEKATFVMLRDGNRDKLIVGKTKAQLKNRFGSLLTLSEASPYYKGCLDREGWDGKEVLMIRTSPWGIVFVGDTAVDLILFKGC